MTVTREKAASFQNCFFYHLIAYGILPLKGKVCQIFDIAVTALDR